MALKLTSNLERRLKMRQIELPKKRQDCNMSTWHRVTEKDGSTIAYCPDIVTAREIAAVPDMLKACINFINLRDKLETIIQKAKGES